MMSKVAELITLYTYQSVDGVTRNRCYRHMPQSGPYRPQGKKFFRRLERVSSERCYECLVEEMSINQGKSKGSFER